MGDDWRAWHAAYDDPASPLSLRLEIVQHHLREALDRCPPGPIRLLSLCAGEGRDVLGVLPGHPRRADVSACLVELDGELAARAAGGAAAAGLEGVEVRTADAGTSSAWADVTPVDVLLLCGIFGNVPDEDVRRTVLAAPGLCRAGATVLWTRHRRPPDLTPAIRGWFVDAGFDEVAFDAPDGERFRWVGAGVARLRDAGPPVGPDERLFAFGP